MKDPMFRDFLKSKYRRKMWTNAVMVLKKLEKNLPVSAVYLRGSFATKKKRPADVDLILLLKTKGSKKARWSVDFVVVPDNKFGDLVLKDASLWMKQKYGAKKSAFLRLR